MKNKKVFVSGGSGFIGSHLVDRLVDNGYVVTVYDNLSSGKREFLEKHFKNSTFKFIQADLLDIETLKKSIIGNDIVFHLAANPDIRYGIEYTDTDLKQNTIATYNILESMRCAGIKQIAFSSTSAIYGEPKIIPTPEDYGPLFPISLYGASKLACEALITSFCHTFDMRSWIFRFANIVGGRGTHGILFDFIRKLKVSSDRLEILGDGKQQKSYLLVDDCVDAILFIVDNSSSPVSVYNLGSGDFIDITSIAKILLKEKELESTTLEFTGGDRGWPGDVPKMALDVSKLNNFGWKSKYSSKEAISIAVKRMLSE